mmetsp:Transcript_15184/g.24583  ORF Transcript_15184/g.24583 Transcript_15184/m.24583 type:complete len:247 (-) Transcript_15184:1373-2113(-)
MRANRADQDNQGFSPLGNHSLVNRNGTVLTPTTVFVSRQEHLKPSMLQTFSKLHLCKRFSTLNNQTIRLIDQDFIHEIKLAIGTKDAGSQSFCDPSFFVAERNNGRICGLTAKIGVVQGISGIRTGKSGCISTVLIDSVVHHQKVSFRLCHFLGVNQDMTITVISTGPQFWLFFPNGSMVEKSHRQVIWDQVFGAYSKSHWIPVSEFVTHRLELLLGDLATFRVWFIAIDIVKNTRTQVLRVDLIW